MQLRSLSPTTSFVFVQTPQLRKSDHDDVRTHHGHHVRMIV